MYTLIKLIQYLVRALNSEGTPGQVAAGFALGAALGLTPLLNLHNLVIVALILVFRVSVPGALLGWIAMVPFGFLLDPVFDAIGQALLTTSGLVALWTAVYNTPVLAFANLNNSVVLGSVAAWIVLTGPLFLAARWGVARYRATVYERLRGTRVFKAVTASKLYNVYRLFRP